MGRRKTHRERNTKHLRDTEYIETKTLKRMQNIRKYVECMLGEWRSRLRVEKTGGGGGWGLQCLIVVADGSQQTDGKKGGS